jgi:hypothetical protein
MKLNLGSINDSIVIDKILCEDNIYHIHCHVRGKYVECPKCHKLTKSGEVARFPYTKIPEN